MSYRRLGIRELHGLLRWYHSSAQSLLLRTRYSEMGWPNQLDWHQIARADEQLSTRFNNPDLRLAEMDTPELLWRFSEQNQRNLVVSHFQIQFPYKGWLQTEPEAVHMFVLLYWCVHHRKVL